MRTYCRAEMKFIDVTALADASVTTDDNQGIGSIELFAEQTEQIEEYDETLVRRMIEKITVYEDRFTVEFKSGTSVDVKR